ncbi:helix-turn-helix domain-containing protein [Corynebacterium sp. USCH3]|uniref:IclR family transcriptional regulator n=1 Tax=Corynebacterium sp. USCH3 TaxID=3024840 RepID=UPI0030A47673
MANSRSGESVLQRAMRILECFHPDQPRLTAAQVAAATGLSRSTTHRLVTEMTSVGMLQRLPDGSVTVSDHSWETSVRCSPLEQLRDLARPVLEDLHAHFDHHLFLAVPDFGELSVLYLEHYDAQYPLRIVSRHASRLPIHDNSAGLTMLAFAGAASVGRVLDGPLSDRVTGEPVDPARIRAELRRIRHQGYGHIVGGMVTENTSFAVPCFTLTDRSVQCALGLVARTDRCDHDEVLAALTAAGRQLSVALTAAQSDPHSPGLSRSTGR